MLSGHRLNGLSQGRSRRAVSGLAAVIRSEELTGLAFFEAFERLVDFDDTRSFFGTGLSC